MPSLIIIDMQLCFETARDQNIIYIIGGEIEYAKAKNYDIIVVESKHQGPTISYLKNLIQDYRQFACATKDQNDGSLVIKNALKNNRFDNSELYVCGVNIEFCVKDTVIGLIKKFENSKIKVIKPACNGIQNDWSEYNFDGFEFVDSIGECHACL